MVHQHGDHHDIPDEHKVFKAGAWLPADYRIHHEWLGRQVEHVKRNPKELIPVLKEFKDLIENNTRIYMLFIRMFEEIPAKHPYNKDPTGRKQVRDYHHLLEILNHTFTTAPPWIDAAVNVGLVGTPMQAVLDYSMGTPSGYAAFLDPDVNRMLKKVLNEWGKFLQSPASAEVLGEDKQGWFGEVGKKDIMEVANAPYNTSYRFEDFFECDPKAKHHGYKSWDDFFTRKIRDEVRPIASPQDDYVIANACESEVFKVARNIKLRDHFWIKGQPYSVRDMLAHHPLADNFAGGTVYQAFLSALSYHRWHAPVSGTVTKAFVQDGTYFSEPLFEGIEEPGVQEIDGDGMAIGQGYLTALATRAIIFIEADNPAIGLLAFIGVGMVEVSTCEITVKEGEHITKGQQIGMFHFGGSSYVLLFRKHVNVDGFPSPSRSANVPVRGQVAVIKPEWRFNLKFW